MAKIWPVYEGARPTFGEPWAELPWKEAISLFKLSNSDFLSDLATVPRFGITDRDLTFAGYKHIVVELSQHEVRAAKWKPGFYKSKVKPDEAFRKLIQHAFEKELGKENIDRVEWQPTIDSQGREALRITVVIAPNATQRFKEGAVLDALVKVQERLQEMKEDRTPIVEYVTEAELRQDAGP